MTSENQMATLVSGMGSAGAGIAILPNTSNGLGAWIAGLLIVSGLLVIGSFIAMKLYAKLADKK